MRETVDTIMCPRHGEQYIVYPCLECEMCCDCAKCDKHPDTSICWFCFKCERCCSELHATGKHSCQSYER